jgi:hypothetical protein
MYLYFINNCNYLNKFNVSRVRIVDLLELQPTG